MKVLQVSGTDRVGGAGVAAYRLHQGLREAGIISQMLVSRKVTSDPTVYRLLPRMNRWQRLQKRLAERRHNHQLEAHPRRPESAYWSLNNTTYPIADVINAFGADVVHIHWIGDNYLPIQQLAGIQAPIVWTLHDMWALTGGCHYALTCDTYQTGCGNCPQLVRPHPQDISQQIIAQKLDAWAGGPMTIVCPSRWLADCVQQSQVLKNKPLRVIPNGIDTTQFKPIDRHAARHALNLPQDKKLVLFGAYGGTEDPRKGFPYLQQALHTLPEQSDIELVIFGAEQPETLDVNLPLHQIGRLNDTVSIALLYSACDVFVLPSLQDNLPNTLVEALACGTPCVAFDSGGIPDIIQHEKNGYLAELQDVDDLADGIQRVLDEALSPEAIHADTAARYALPQVVDRYHQLYRTLLA